ncbi:hypothetical protein Fcan01_20059 [Folsomia candida]|uniref:BEN domain-containing protein n=1 Tax=Folsomia candida TaxID=158441 RepID=A0A226DJQ9_FOLCA|nr:hypothetical protein Fcan01_20059 [Folsomia candida]
MKSFVVIHWVEENSYSLVSLKNVELGEKTVDQVIHSTVNVRVDKQVLEGVVMGIGPKNQMKNMQNTLAEEAANKSFLEKSDNLAASVEQDKNKGNGTRSRKRNRQNSEGEEEQHSLILAPGSGTSEAAINREESLSNNNDEEVEVSSLEERRTNLLKDQQIALLLKENFELKKHVASLKRIVKRASSTPQPEGVDELHQPTFRIPKRKLLFEGGIFTLEEIASSSLTGKVSPLFPATQRCAMDPVRFGALKEFTIRTCGLKPNSVEFILFEQKLKNIPGDARKKLSRAK